MATTQTTVRASDATIAKWDTLANQYGTKTEVFAIAIDRMYQQEGLNMFKVGDRVKVKPHTVYRTIFANAEVTPAQAQQHNGYHEATINALLENGAVEVEVNHGYDIVPKSTLELLERESQHATYTVPTDPTYYGNNCIDGEACADAIIQHLSAYATEQGYDVEFRKVPETMSFGNRDHGDQEILDDINAYHNDNWIEWCPLDAYEA